VALGHGEAAGSPESGDSGGALGRGEGHIGGGAHHGPICGRSCSGGAAGDGAPRLCPVPAAEAAVPARWRHGRG
jgi:hypothetical protein